MTVYDAVETTRDMQDAAESYIDQHSDPAIGVSNALDAIAEVCWGKAEHLRTNWQDDEAAKVWDRLAKIVNDACAKATS